MINFTYIQDVPNAPNNPSSDQPNMKINTNSNHDIWEVDHIGFGVANGGTHEQLSFYQNVAGSLGTAVALIYPATRPATYTNSTGSGNSSFYMFSQDSSTYPLPMSCIKAGGTFSAGTGSRTFSSQFNCNGTPTGTAISGGYQYEIALQSGVTTGSNVIVQLSVQKNSIPSSIDITSWSYTNPNLTIFCADPSVSISFLVIQI